MAEGVKNCPRCKDDKPISNFYDTRGQRRVKCTDCNAGNGLRGRPPNRKPSKRAIVIDGERYCSKGEKCVSFEQLGNPQKLSKHNRSAYCYPCRDSKMDRQVGRTQRRLQALQKAS